MPGRGWDDSWQKYPASVPLRAEGGIASSKQRGPMATSWWSRRFIQVLESFGLGARMQRGRRYARTGQVLSLDVTPALIAAQVQGSRRTPYVITISLPEPSVSQWRAIDAAMSAKIGFVARLLGGELPPDLEEVFAAAGVELFPPTWSAVRSNCNCPDWENPCKHIAAVLYVFADQLDSDPWLLLAWRGRTRDQVLDALRGDAGGRRDAGGRADAVAPWWPFAPGPLPALPARERAPVNGAELAGAVECPDAVLDILEPLDVLIGGASIVELVRPAYALIVAAAPPSPVHVADAADAKARLSGDTPPPAPRPKRRGGSPKAEPGAGSATGGKIG